MFAEMPLDNRTVDKLATLVAILAPGPLLNVTAGQNDLMFRRERYFCNIEPKDMSI